LEDALLGIWKELGTTILLVTHDIEEAIYLSDRVHVLARRPSRVIETVAVSLPRPRDQLATRAAPRFMELRNAIYQRIANAG
jgi:NitT/TauT family transport system ATP-binding protein